MSSQSIIIKSIKSIESDAEKSILDNAKKYLLKEDYSLGKGNCSFETMDSLKTIDIINKNNCYLNNIVEETLQNFKGQDCNEEDELLGTINYGNNKRNSLYDLWKSKGNSGNKNDFLEAILNNSNDSSNSLEIPSFTTNPDYVPNLGAIWFNETQNATFIMTSTGIQQFDINEGEVVDAFGVPTGIDI